MEICRKAVSIAPLKSGAVIRLDHAVMYLYFMTDRIVRMRVCFEEKEETSWETLRNNLPTLLGVSLSGQPNTGCDIGGFAGPAPEEELLCGGSSTGFSSRVFRFIQPQAIIP